MKLNQLSKFLLILFIIVLPSCPSFAAKSIISINNWKENTNLTPNGKISAILVQGQIQNIQPGQIMTSFSINLDRRRNIKITKVTCDGRMAKYSFSNNSLNIKFPEAKRLNNKFSVYFAYKEKYKDIHESLRQEIINVPAFAAGAKSKVTINFPGSMESATLNPNITKIGNSFVYENIVPLGGVVEKIKLTSSKAVWDVIVKIKISADNPLKKVIVTTPSYFRNAGQKVDNFFATSNIHPEEQSAEKGKRTLKFNTTGNKIIIKNKARISIGVNNRIGVFRNPKDYLKYSAEESVLLSPLLRKIKQNPKYKNLPLYAKIGDFVHDYIKYDIRYVGRLPKIRKILENKVGVCTEYASLYNALARVAGIPALIVNGAACGEYSKCRGHAWNMIYVNYKWISIDPTWDLMSGIVSSSHVYFNDNDDNSVGIQYFGDLRKIKSEIDFEMTKPQQ